MRRLALRARGLTASSCSEAVTGLRVISRTTGFLPHTQTGRPGGQVQGLARFRKQFYTILSSSEWKVMMQMRPPGRSMSTRSRIAASSGVNSSLTAMRSA